MYIYYLTLKHKYNKNLPSSKIWDQFDPKNCLNLNKLALQLQTYIYILI